MAPRTPRKNSQPQIADSAPSPETPQLRPKSLVFISHDTRDADLAELFANLLSDVSGGILKSFRSSDKKGASGIEFGAEWYTTIMSQLGDATDVVALLTPHSLDRPWILYEAGVAKGKLDTVVFGVALGVPLERVSTGPFGQFQNCNDDEDSLTKLVMQLLRRNPDAAPREEAVRMQVKLFLEKTSENLKPQSNIGNQKTTDLEDKSAKLFEEVKAMVREMPDRIENRMNSRRMNPKNRPGRESNIYEDILFRRRPDDEDISINWLVFISLLKEDVPWLYEPGIEIYRKYKLKKSITKEVAEFNKLTGNTLGSPNYRQIFDEIIDSARIREYFPDMIHAFLREMIERQGPANSVATSL